MEVLYFFESIRNPFLDAIMTAFTYLGSEIAFIVFALIVYWCVDKKRGFFVLSVGYIGVIINQLLKIIFMVPRPWVIDKDFTIVESARADAEGYSFPSGHTQNAVGTYGSIARFLKKRWSTIVSIVLIIAIAVSRMYLGVHTPLDVGVSILIGTALVFGLYPIFKLSDRKPVILFWLLGGFFLSSVAFLIFSFCYSFPADIDKENLFSMQKIACSLVGATGAAFAFYPIEERFIRFETKAPFPIQLLKLAVGCTIVIGVKEVLKYLFIFIGGGAEPLWLRAVRYFAVVACVIAVAPLTFRFLTKIGAKKHTEKTD